jgi:hypothetical protein
MKWRLGPTQRFYGGMKREIVRISKFYKTQPALAHHLLSKQNLSNDSAVVGKLLDFLP